VLDDSFGSEDFEVFFNRFRLARQAYDH
jgi:hypothetical protein